MPSKPGAIQCRACGRESFLLRAPTYEGFTKTGEKLSCAACGHVYAREEDVPYQGVRQVRVFDASEAPQPVKLFQDAEKGRFCRYCRNYVVNPFTQRCGLTRREVQATDCCGDFDPKPTPSSAP